MGASLNLRTFNPHFLQQGIEAIVEQFPAPQTTAFEQEIATGSLVHLGQQWEELQAALMGSDRSLSSVPSQVVLGGAIIGHSEETQTMVIALQPHEVTEVKAYLEGIDPEEIRSLTESHAEEIEEVLGEIEEWEDFRAFFSTSIEELRAFYSNAAKTGAAVVKLVY